MLIVLREKIAKIGIQITHTADNQEAYPSHKNSTHKEIKKKVEKQITIV
jgi:hypothetical protein